MRRILKLMYVYEAHGVDVIRDSRGIFRLFVEERYVRGFNDLPEALRYASLEFDAQIEEL